jgi:hypothetical protein
MPDGRDLIQLLDTAEKWGEHKGNIEEENNGYIVFILNIHGSAGK